MLFLAGENAALVEIMGTRAFLSLPIREWRVLIPLCLDNTLNRAATGSQFQSPN
jgi:hypothetical protein